MAESINTNEQYVSQSTVKNCVDRLMTITKTVSAPKFELIAHEKVIEIDILLIAYFILFKKKFPDLTLTIILNSEQQLDIDPILFKLKQYMVYAYITTNQSVFEVKLGGHDKSPLKINVDSTRPFADSWLVISESFLPFIFVAHDTYKTFWETIPPNLENPGFNIEFDGSNEQLYNNCHQALTKMFIPSNGTELITTLAKIAFYNALEKAKILNFNLSEAKKNVIDKSIIANLKAGYLSHQSSILFYEKIKPLFVELSKMPPIYHFFYSTLLSTDLVPSKLKNDNQIEFISTLENLWNFTKELLDGLQELAKNIVEHSSDKMGVITGKLYSIETIRELKRTKEKENELLERFLKKSNNPNQKPQISLLDLNIIDLGNAGITETLIHNIKEASSEDEIYKHFATDDLTILESGKVSLVHFLDPNKGITLMHQAKRATAHLGLLKFAKLVDSNKGILRASTRKREGFGINRDNFPRSSDYDFLPFGTNYNVVLPIDPSIQYKPRIHQPIEIPNETTATEIRGIEDLLTCCVLRLNEPFDFQIEQVVGERVLFCLVPSPTELKNRPSEIAIWGKLDKIVKQIRTSNMTSFIALNLENLRINSSQLFRLIGWWELSHPKLPLIVYNIETEIFLDLKKINDLFLKKTFESLPFWNVNSLILVYSFLKIESRGRFSFVDALWGNDKDDFLKVNGLIRKTNFNTTFLLGDKIDSKFNSASNFIKYLPQFNIFHDEITLLPFDLLLESDNQLTLFEQNAAILLQNELKTL